MITGDDMEVFSTIQKQRRRAIDLVGRQLTSTINPKQQNIWF